MKITKNDAHITRDVLSRWKSAQSGESRCWEKNVKKILTSTYRKNKTLYWEKILKKLTDKLDLKKLRILDVGCGPSGVVLYLRRGYNLVCLDPLMNVYLKLFPYLHKFDATYVHSQIEKYSPKQRFDVIFCFNSIDHVNDIHLALRRLNMLLQKKGTIIITLNCHNYSIIQKLLSRYNFILDKLHPHQFLTSQYEEMLKTSGLKIIKKINLDNETHWINTLTQANNGKKVPLQNRLSPGKVFFGFIELIFGIKRYGLKHQKNVYSHVAFICGKD